MEYLKCVQSSTYATKCSTHMAFFFFKVRGSNGHVKRWESFWESFMGIGTPLEPGQSSPALALFQPHPSQHGQRYAYADPAPVHLVQIPGTQDLEFSAQCQEPASMNQRSISPAACTYRPAGDRGRAQGSTVNVGGVGRCWLGCLGRALEALQGEG